MAYRCRRSLFVLFLELWFVKTLSAFEINTIGQLGVQVPRISIELSFPYLCYFWSCSFLTQKGDSPAL
jgi:hypothetical protein